MTQPGPHNPKFDVFVSYSSQNKDWVHTWLLPHLESAGLRVCIDTRNFKIGKSILTNIEEAVLVSRKTLLVLTPQWLTSQWTSFESLLLQTDDPAGIQGRMLPLLLERCEPPKRLGIFTYADFTDSDQWTEQITRVVDAIRTNEQAKEIEEENNPFVSRSGITRSEMFFDRENEQRTLRQFMRGRTNCQIVGPRRIGKTSLLRHVERVASEWQTATVVGYLDLEDPRCINLNGWLNRAAHQFGWRESPSTLADFAERVDTILQAGQKLVLCLDQFEELAKRPDQFTPDFFLTLRACGHLGMSIFTTSRKELNTITNPEDQSSAFYNTFGTDILDAQLFACLLVCPKW